MANDRSGLVAGLIMGVGALIIVALIVFTMVGTMTEANLLRSTATTTTAHDNLDPMNETGFVIAGFDLYANRDYAVTLVEHIGGLDIPTANYTFSSATGVLASTSAEADVNDGVNVTYTYVPYTTYENTLTRTNANVSEGIRNVNNKIPTILLIGAIVLLLGVLVLLMRQAQASGFVGSSQGSL